MDVTSENFNEVFPRIEEAIDKCTFLAIDTEFTGLNARRLCTAFDTPTQYYEKVYKNSRNFLVIQYGISAFRFDDSTQKFVEDSYNFYIFRKPYAKLVPDKTFFCQSSSIDFLMNHNFDFNKLFKSGIPYLNDCEEVAYRDAIEEKEKGLTAHSSSSDEPQIPIPDEWKDFIKDVMEQIGNFNSQSKDEEFTLPKCNAFVRKLLYQEVNKKWTNKIALRSKQVNNDRLLVATKISSKRDEDKIRQNEIDAEKSRLNDYLGFTKVLKAIINSGKLIVAHNAFFDIFHTVNTFLTPLDNSYEEFKECVHALFPKLLDTKYLASSEPFKDLFTSTILKDLIDTVRKKPFEISAVTSSNTNIESKNYNIDCDRQHEAGYDAYVTGIVFITMWRYLGTSGNLPKAKIFSNFDLLEPYINRIFLMIRDYQYAHLAGEDLKPDRDHVFYLTFPKDWKTGNIIELFSPFGTVHIAWIDDSSAYIALYRKEHKAIVLSTLSQSDTYGIKTYAARQKELNAQTNSSHCGAVEQYERETKPQPRHNINQPSPVKKSVKRKSPTVGQRTPPPPPTRCSKRLKSSGGNKQKTLFQQFEAIQEEAEDEGNQQQQQQQQRKLLFPETDWTT